MLEQNVMFMSVGYIHIDNYMYIVILKLSIQAA